MARVNVMTALSDTTTFAGKKVGMWKIEIINDSFPVEEEGFLVRENITGRELTLQLLTNALYKAKKSEIEFDSIEMYFDFEGITSAFQKGWFDKWAVQKWKNAKGKEIPYKDTWMLIYNLLEQIGKRYIVSQSKSRWENRMHDLIWKEIKRINDKEVADEAVEKVKKMLA